MQEFPLSPIYIGKIDSEPDADRINFKTKMVELWRTPSTLSRLPEMYPHRVCPRVGKEAYKEGFMGRENNRLFRNAILNDACCGIRYSIDGNNQVRVTINLGGEYLFADPSRNTFLVIWADHDKQQVLYKLDENGTKRFHVPKSSDLLLSNEAEAFFNKQRSLAKCTENEMRAVRSNTGRFTLFDKFKLG